MNRSHAAALVLVGWYLMVPPLKIEGPPDDPKTPVDVDTKAPLSQWKNIGSFDTAKQCYDYPEHFLGMLRSNGKEHGGDAMAKYWFDHSQCIATDDPRLKEK
jgi:hypothetical protein